MAKYYGGVSESSGNTGATQGNTGGDPFASGAAQSDPFSSGASQDALSSTASQAGALSSDTAQLDQAPSQMLQGSVQQTQLFGEVSNDFANQPPGNPSGGGCSMPPLKAMTPKLDTTPPGQTPKVPPPPPNIPLIPETATSQTPPPTKPLIGKVAQNRLIGEVSKNQQTPPPITPRRPLIGKVQKNKPSNGNKNKPVDLKSDKAKPDKEENEEKKPTLRGKAGWERSETETERDHKTDQDGNPKKKVTKKKPGPSIQWGINVPIKDGALYKDPGGRGEVLPWELNAGATKTKDGTEIALTAGAALAKWNAGNEKSYHGSLSVGTVEGGAKVSISNNPLDRHANLEAGVEANLVKVSAETPTYKSVPIFGKVLTVKFSGDAGLGVGAKFKMKLAEGKEGFRFRTSSHAGFGPAAGGTIDFGWGDAPAKGGKK